jgi:phage shock protein A
MKIEIDLSNDPATVAYAADDLVAIINLLATRIRGYESHMVEVKKNIERNEQAMAEHAEKIAKLKSAIDYDKATLSQDEARKAATELLLAQIKGC